MYIWQNVERSVFFVEIPNVAGKENINKLKVYGLYDHFLVKTSYIEPANPITGLLFLKQVPQIKIFRTKFLKIL